MPRIETSRLPVQHVTHRAPRHYLPEFVSLLNSERPPPGVAAANTLLDVFYSARGYEVVKPIMYLSL